MNFLKNRFQSYIETLSRKKQQQQKSPFDSFNRTSVGIKIVLFRAHLGSFTKKASIKLSNKMEVSQNKKKNKPKHFSTYKMGSNTPTLRNHGLGQIFHQIKKEKKDFVGLDETSLGLGGFSEGFEDVGGRGCFSPPSWRTAVIRKPGRGKGAGGGDPSAPRVP